MLHDACGYMWFRTVWIYMGYVVQMVLYGIGFAGLRLGDRWLKHNKI